MGIRTFFCLALGAATLASCIQDEPLNAEADIVAVTFDKDNRDVLLNTTDTVIKISTDAAASNIEIAISPMSDVTSVAPTFVLSEGASITHDESGRDGNGLALDFTSPQHYTVTSEDGNYRKSYTLSFKRPATITRFDFEHFEMIAGGRYINYYELDEDGSRCNIWATANAGYAMCGRSDFPTQRYDRGQSGNGVRLRTESTGGFGEMMGMRIAAGNLFFGQFDAVNAVSAPRAATLFGMPFNRVPKTFTGYYMFKPGETVTNDIGEVQYGVVDAPDFYVVMYENSIIVNGKRQSVMLNGDTVLEHPNIVGLARIQDPEIWTDEQIENGEWKRFEIPFELVNGKQIDEEKLANYGYNIAIVLSSSIKGANFYGAVGSTLYIDTLEIICEE